MAANYAAMGIAAANGVYTTFLWIALLLVVVAIAGFFLWYSLFNIKLRLRVKTNTYDYVIDTRARIAKDRDGIEALRIWRYKVKSLPSPPPEAISLTRNGKRVLEVEIDESGGARFIIKKTLTQEFEPFNTNDREFYVSEVKKAQLKKKLTISELILQLAPLTAIIVIFVVSLIYWGEVMGPAIQFGESNKQIALTQAETVSMLKEIIKREQIITGEEPGGFYNVTPPD